LQLAQQDRVGEVAVVADLQPGVLAEGEVDPVHGAVGADHERPFPPAAEALERVVARDQAVRPDADVRRQLAVGPAAGRGRGVRAHDVAPSAGIIAGSPNWTLYRWAYSPPRASSSSCVPSSVILPSSSTTMRSAWRMVDSRWAMMSVVRPFMSRRSASSNNP